MALDYDWRTALYQWTGIALWSWRPSFLRGAWVQRRLYQPLIADNAATDALAREHLESDIRESNLRLVGITTTNVYRQDEFGVVSKYLVRRLAGADRAVDAVTRFFAMAPLQLYAARTQGLMVLRQGLDDPMRAYGWCDLPYGIDAAYIQLQDLTPGFVSAQITYVPSAWLEAIATVASSNLPRNNMEWHISSSGFSLSHSSSAIGKAAQSLIDPYIRRVTRNGLLPPRFGLITDDMYPAGIAKYWSARLDDPERSRLLREILGVSAYGYWASDRFYMFDEAEPIVGVKSGNVTWLIVAGDDEQDANSSVPDALLEAELDVLPWTAVWRGVQQIRLHQASHQAMLAAMSRRRPGSIRRWRLWKLSRALLILRFRLAELTSLVGEPAPLHHDAGVSLFFGQLHRRGIGRMKGDNLDLGEYVRNLRAEAKGTLQAAQVGADMSTAAASELLTIRAAAIMQALTVATMLTSVLALIVAIASIWIAATSKPH